MAIPEYVICTECDAPCYVFEWRNDRVTEAVCEICGNDEPETFLTEEEMESYEEESPVRWRGPRH